jgi:hypothetical protein
MQSEIDSQTLHLPIGVAHRLQATAAQPLGLRRDLGGTGVDGGTPRRGLGQRALGGRAEGALRHDDLRRLAIVSRFVLHRALSDERAGADPVPDRISRKVIV